MADDRPQLRVPHTFIAFVLIALAMAVLLASLGVRTTICLRSGATRKPRAIPASRPAACGPA